MRVKLNDAGNYGKPGFLDKHPNQDYHDGGPSYKLRKCSSCGKSFKPKGDERTCISCKNKKKNESIDKSLKGHKLVPRTNAKDLPKAVYQKLIFDYDMQINCQDEEFPMPWDADFSIKGTDFILTGHAGPSGFGTCTTTIPLKNATRMIEFEVYNGLVDKDGYPDQDLIDQLNALGWDYK